MIKLLRLLLLVAICFRPLFSYSQKSTDSVSSLNRQLDLQTRYYVQKLIIIEMKFKKTLAGVDSNAAKGLFLDAPEGRYLCLAGKVTSLKQFRGKIDVGEELCKSINTRLEQIGHVLDLQPFVPKHLRRLYSRYSQLFCYYSGLVQFCKDMPEDNGY